MLKDTERTCAIIDLSAVRGNYAAARRAFPESRIMTVMKADAYGHGIAGLVPTCDPLTDWYAAATVEEACAIRNHGGTKPILLFGPAPSGLILTAAGYGITLSVGSLQYAKQVSEILSSAGCSADIQIKLDTGLNRTGIRVREEEAGPGAEMRSGTGMESAAESGSGAMTGYSLIEPDYVNEIKEILSLPGVHLTGVYSHLACPESEDPSDIAFTQMQVRRYETALRDLEEAGIDTGLHHIASTGGAIAHPEYTYDMIRVGMMIYGQCDTEDHYRELGLTCALTWAARVIQTEAVSGGESISYGRTYRAPRDMTIAVISCGYADGYRRAYQHGGIAILRGKIVPVIGRICMDYLMLDISEVPEAQTGDEVILLGYTDTASVSAICLAEIAESTCGEVTGAIAARVPRRYTDSEADLLPQ